MENSALDFEVEKGSSLTYEFDSGNGRKPQKRAKIDGCRIGSPSIAKSMNYIRISARMIHI